MAAVLLEPGSRLLHIGPHKTGTTAIQGALHLARERLAAEGVVYPGRGRQPLWPVLAVTGQPALLGGPRPEISYWDSLVRDVRAAGDCERLAEETAARFGGIDVLCANAGVFPDVKLADLTEDDIDSIFATNVKGCMLTVKACLPHLERSGHGRVILTSSLTGLRGQRPRLSSPRAQEERAGHGGGARPASAAAGAHRVAVPSHGTIFAGGVAAIVAGSVRGSICVTVISASASS